MEKTVCKIREFNRFYLPVFDLLGNRYLGSEYSATEARVLFELYENDGCNAAYVSRKMNIDKSYLSRVIQKHERSGYVFRCVSEIDARAYELHLTGKGKCKVEELIEKSNAQIAETIKPLDAEACGRLYHALSTVMEILENRTGAGGASL